MNKSNLFLSSLVGFSSYAKFIPHLGRRELIEEVINRNLQMHLDKFPALSKDILKAYQQVHDLKVMPSMRSMQFGGDAILKNNTRLYNCSFVHVKEPRVFAEILYLLLCGTGVGYSVQKHHTNQLPTIRKPKEEAMYLIPDSIEGWAEALNQLMSAYFYGGIRPLFDYSQIRPRGSLLVTTGAKAPGPEPLKQLLVKIESKLKTSLGKKLTPLEAHDIICISADGVLAGGIRRAACISLFDRFDEEMLRCKHGEWWLKHPYRARSNNSAVLPRELVTKDEFKHIFDMCIKSNAGEPGFSWTNDIELGYNPCHEQSLLSHQFCNLTTTALTNIQSNKDLHNRVYAAGLIGTLQASYTNFGYLSEKWQEVTEKDALLGCSFTGIADSPSLTAEQLQESAKLILSVNEKYSKKIGTNLASRVTNIKPEGSTSCIVGSSSGIHARHSDFYLRRIRQNKDSALAKYITSILPDLVEEDFSSQTSVVITIPQESPKGSITRDNETALTLFNRVLFYSKNWIVPGHRKGNNYNNVSCTINYKPEEIDDLFEQMWLNRYDYSGISLLPFDGSVYKQAPFEACTKEVFQEYNTKIQSIDLSKVMEFEDNTELLENLACSGGVCEYTGK